MQEHAGGLLKVSSADELDVGSVGGPRVDFWGLVSWPEYTGELLGVIIADLLYAGSVGGTLEVIAECCMCPGQLEGSSAGVLLAGRSGGFSKERLLSAADVKEARWRAAGLEVSTADILELANLFPLGKH